MNQSINLSYTIKIGISLLLSLFMTIYFRSCENLFGLVKGESLPDRMSGKVVQTLVISAYPSGEHEFTPVFSGIRITGSLVLCVMVCRSLFILLFFFVWSSSVLLRFTDADHPFGIFKLFITPPLFINVHVPSTIKMYLCLKRIDIASFYDLLLHFELFRPCDIVEVFIVLNKSHVSIFKTCFFKLKTKHRIFLFFQSLIFRWFWKQKITSIIDEMKVK
jgi:hypothetical protein